jgi:hypothetical protein
MEIVAAQALAINEIRLFPRNLTSEGLDLARGPIPLAPCAPMSRTPMPG